MSIIAGIDVSHHRLPQDPPFMASWDGRPRRQFDVTVVRVTDNEGRVGIGQDPWSLERRDYLLTQPFDQQDGWLELGETPGFGVELDEDALAVTRIG